ncbi:hypothetical protein QFZ30_000278 [Arthrobacter pascens]|uniref:hypothetical protein n=1 Tax=Arthrobacter pascens TaxID=1677 RepID=UPI002790D70C|nr:hypothetical protein [Arthrobacter pascens]MDQ0676896.1 hypothetical protein [Arthrobacter pascens]
MTEYGAAPGIRIGAFARASRGSGLVSQDPVHGGDVQEGGVKGRIGAGHFEDSSAE